MLRLIEDVSEAHIDQSDIPISGKHCHRSPDENNDSQHMVQMTLVSFSSVPFGVSGKYGGIAP